VEVDGFVVTTWAPGDDSGNPDVPTPSREVKLDEFVDAISTSFGVEAFQGKCAFSSGDRRTKRRLSLSSNDEDGTITTASIYTVNSP
jgi:hypothetical protein